MLYYVHTVRLASPCLSLKFIGSFYPFIAIPPAQGFDLVLKPATIYLVDLQLIIGPNENLSSSIIFDILYLLGRHMKQWGSSFLDN